MLSAKTIIEYQARTKEYLIALCTNTNFVKLVNDESKSHYKVCQWLIENEERSKLNYYVPTVKEVSESTQLKSAIVTKFLKDIYYDILLLNENEPEKFAETGSVICYLQFNYLGSRGFFCLGLKAIPRLGERFDFNFIIPKTGGNYFFVKSISHKVENNKQLIFISLDDQEPFLYLELLKQKEYLNNWLSYEEFHQPINDSLKKILLSGKL